LTALLENSRCFARRVAEATRRLIDGATRTALTMSRSGFDSATSSDAIGNFRDFEMMVQLARFADDPTASR